LLSLLESRLGLARISSYDSHNFTDISAPNSSTATFSALPDKQSKTSASKSGRRVGKTSSCRWLCKPCSFPFQSNLVSCRCWAHWSPNSSCQLPFHWSEKRTSPLRLDQFRLSTDAAAICIQSLKDIHRGLYRRSFRSEGKVFTFGVDQV
jgi:hypothetical protein